MSAIEEIKPLAMRLSESERANLALRLLQSLPATLRDEDDGIAEAARRDEELRAYPASGISLPELDERVRQTRRV